MTTPTHLNQHVPTSSSSTSPTAPPVGSSLCRRASAAVVVAGSLVAGFLAAVALVAAPVVPATESALTGAVLCGFAIGLGILAGLSMRFAAQPQRWAVVPAAVLGAGGVSLLLLGSSAHPTVDWVWPPVLIGLALWMSVRIRREVASRAARWLLYPVIGAMGISAVGGAYQTIGTATDVWPSMPGRLVDVGGHRLHLSCSGSGSPTVVVEAGGGEMAANLGWITPAVARDTTICVYDRAGRGWSEEADAPQDAVAISTDLDTLLHRAGVPGPYVMAGHSFGGLYALTFAANHPDEVSGMVLVDSTSPHDGRGVAPAAPPAVPGSYDVLGRVAALTSSTARLGLGRLYSTVAVVDLPPLERDAVRASTATAATLRSTIEEYARANASMDEAASLRDFGDKPLIVLTAGAGSAAGWTQQQDRLAALSTDSVHRVVRGATHEALVGDAAHAASTSRAILEVVTAVRTGRPLSR
jgi:pimeloyl-ACP methyl ester carboxylesterase